MVTLLTPFLFAGLLVEAVLLSVVFFANVVSGIVSKNNANAKVGSRKNVFRSAGLASLHAGDALACVIGDSLG